MMNGINISRCFAAAPVTVRCMRALMCCAVCACAISAQPASARQSDEDQLPDAAGVIGAYMQARQWVTDFALPGVDDARARVSIENASGICAIVRRGGRVMGMGIDRQGDHLMLRRAVGRALSEVWTDDVVKRMPDSIRNTLGPELVLELEVAGPLIPLPGRTYEDVSRRLEPGLDGIAMRRSDRLEMRFPSQMLANNLAGRVRSLLPGIATDMKLGARPLDELRRTHGVSVYRFRTTHLGQHSASDPPIELFRGSEIIYLPTPVQRDRLLAIGEALSDHIKQHMWAGGDPLGLMGDYQPTMDRYEPIIAPPADQAFVAYALARFAHAVVGEDGNDLERAERLDLSRDILHALAERTSDEPDPAEDIFAAAMIVHAGLSNDLAIGYRPAREMFERAVRNVLRSWDQQRGFVRAVGSQGDDAGEQLRALPPREQAVCVAAVTRLAVSRSEQLTAGGLDPRAMVDQTWARTPVERSLNLLPWLGWAGHDLAQLGADPSDAVTNHLETLAVALARGQWQGGDADLSDCIGAFPVSGGGGSLAFSAQSMRPLTFLAMWANSPHASATDPVRQAAERGVRYLSQLMPRESDRWRYANIMRTSGGLCNATWDARQPLAAQAMALLAISELIDGR